MIKKLITEISESDFRKLDIKVHRNERVVVSENIPGHPVCKFEMVERSLNEILDEQIALTLKSGYASDLMDLKTPVTIAVHEPDGYYLDKFMNRFTGAQDFQIGWGIRHLYSTRDYYEAHEDYWRVSKKETKVIYRITLDSHWTDEFILKHKTDIKPWPYDFLPEGVSPDYSSADLHIEYELDGEIWVERGRSAYFYYEHSQAIIPVDKDGREIEPAWKKDVKSVN